MVEGFRIPEHIEMVSVRALSVSTRQLLAIYLDPPSSILNSDGFAADVSGLAELAGFDSQTILFFQSKSSATSELLDMWQNKKDGTLGNLVRNIKLLERYDCLSEIMQKLLADANVWIERPCTVEPLAADCQTNSKEDSSSATSAETDDPVNILTVDDDVCGATQMYSACICCAEDDLDLARDILNGLSSTTKLFIPQDHLVGGTYEFEATAEVIEDRCDGRLIVILSSCYNESPACSFATQFGKTLDPDARRRRIIPVLREDGVTFPRILRGISTIKYHKCSSQMTFLRQIAASLSLPHKSYRKSNNLSLDSSSSRARTSTESVRNISTSSLPERNSSMFSKSVSSSDLVKMNNQSSPVSSGVSKMLNVTSMKIQENTATLTRRNVSAGSLNNSPRESRLTNECRSLSQNIFTQSNFNDLSPESFDNNREDWKNKPVHTNLLNIVPNRSCSSDPNLNMMDFDKCNEMNYLENDNKVQNDRRAKSKLFSTLKQVFRRSSSKPDLLDTTVRSETLENTAIQIDRKCKLSSTQFARGSPLMSQRFLSRGGFQKDTNTRPNESGKDDPVFV